MIKRHNTSTLKIGKGQGHCWRLEVHSLKWYVSEPNHRDCELRLEGFAVRHNSEFPKGTSNLAKHPN